MKPKIALAFFVIICIAIITRLYKLGDAPAGLYVDEAGQGYSAYSIIQTGKDEFGKSFPLIFRSFTDFKTPVYIYLVSVLIPIFDLSTFTVRLPSFIFSILTFPVLFALIGELAPKKIATSLALITTLLLAVSPWHILFGRTTFETNVALFFLLAGIYLFYKGLKIPKLLILSAVTFAIAFPAYHAQRIITPLIVVALALRYRKVLFSDSTKIYTLLALLVGFIASFPTLSIVTTPGFLARASVLNVFSQVHQLPAGFIHEASGVFSGLINNPIYLSTREFLALYFSYFSPLNIFLLGDSGPRSSYPELSTFYVWQLPFYIYGLYLLFKKKYLGELKFLVIILLIISPIPAALTRDPYSTIRSLQLAIPISIVVGLAIIRLYQKVKDNNLITLLNIGFVFITIFSITKLYSSAIILNEYLRAKDWHYGWKEVSETVVNLNNEMPIVIDNSREEPYSQLAFYLKPDPASFQKNNFEVPLSEYYTNMNRNKIKTFGNITTRPIVWDKDLLIEQYLIGDSLAISEKQIVEHNLTLIKEIDYPDGSPAFRITKTNLTQQ